MTRLRLAVGSALAALLLVAPSANAATFTVDSIDDAPDASTGVPACATAAPVRCTLRAAIQQANADPASADEIIVPAGNYALTLAAGDENAAASGDLDVTGSVLISGAGADATIVRQTVADRVFDIRQLQTASSPIEIEGIGITGGQLGGLRTFTTFTKLVIRDTSIFDNQNTTVGGGLDLLDRAVGFPVAITGSTISGNSAPSGGGIHVDDGAEMTLENSTVSGNTATGASGGGGILTDLSNGSPQGTATLTNVTVTANSASAGPGGAFRNDGTITVRNTIVSGNTGGNCAGSQPLTQQGNNIENGTSCNLNINGDPQLGALADNGGGTQTHAIPAGSPAVNAAVGCPPPAQDQRGISRPQDGACDLGSYELVPSKTVPSVPDCSPTTEVRLAMDPPAGETPVAFKYKIDDGPTQTAPTNDTSEPISLPGEGSFKLEYWSQTSAGEEPQANHLVDTAIVDMTNPTLSVASDQNQSLYVIKRNATVTINAGDALSGLEVNPSAQSEPVGTDSRGAKTVEWTAADLCDNRATEQFSYTVLGPGLGERAVIEPLGDGVEVDLPGDAAAGVSQKGADFEPVTQPREIPIGTTIDASEAGARITSSKSATEGDIKDGTFNAGIFQVLESRNQEKNALTRLRLKGSNFRNCEVGKGANAARLSRRARRRLRGSATGRFRTGGRYSAATVRGTDWEVIDRCDGTLTKVTRGEVAVRDFRLRKTVVVKEGRRYLARAEAPDPVLGKRVTVNEVKGKVFVKLPRGGEFARAGQKGTEFEPLIGERSIPVRSILDTTRGTVALRSARNRKGTIQSGRFAEGVFQVLQSRKRRDKGLTTLNLKGSAAKFRRCGKGGSASARAALTRRQIRRLRARARGRYRTSGRYSAATVRGTTWTVTDRCDGTLTTVKRGKVAVRDFRRKKTVVLTPGKQYLARP